MKARYNPTHALLAAIAVLLALNLVVLVARGGSDASAPDAAMFLPRAEAGSILQGPDPSTIITTNSEGNQLYVWQLGRYVSGSYERVNVDRYEYRN